jgi:signal transduction histidine kinase
VYFFAKKISGPIKKLHEATEAIVAGQPNVHVDIHTHDEIGQLADAFNQMVSKRVVEDLKKDNEQLKKIDQLKSQFVSHVSHEFKSPLCVIKDSISLVLEGVAGEITAKQKEMLSVTKKHTDRLIRLVNDLLDLSKIEAGRMRLNKEKTDIAALVSGILKDYEIEFSKKQLVFTKEIAPDTGLLLADQDKLSEVIINLLDNAIKYSPVGGSISVKLTGDQSAVRFEISDSGREIAKEYQEKIFDKFERITADKEKGTGLGLPISKDIVNLHRGKMWVESPLWKDLPVGQQGSKFIFVLPKDLP